LSTLASIGEWAIIEHLKKELSSHHSQVLCAIGDDASVSKQSGAYSLVTTDLLQEGVHFERSWAPWDHVGYKALQVNFSDIAAMGGRPCYYWLSLSLPKTFLMDDLQGLITGLKRAAHEENVICLGGDTNRSPQGAIINVVVQGLAGKRVLYRHGAQVGDDLYVTGSLGEAALGLKILQANRVGLLPTKKGKNYCLRQTKPRARAMLGQRLADNDCVHAMIDVSDGLASDLDHLLKASQLGAKIYLDALKYKKSFGELCKQYQVLPMDLMICGGEDYELLFAASPGEDTFLAKLSRDTKVPITKIGRLIQERHCHFIDGSGKSISFSKKGYEHFH
jgi:thiamine-monophosphate kinase